MAYVVVKDVLNTNCAYNNFCLAQKLVTYGKEKCICNIKKSSKGIFLVKKSQEHTLLLNKVQGTFLHGGLHSAVPIFMFP